MDEDRDAATAMARALMGNEAWEAADRDRRSTEVERMRGALEAVLERGYVLSLPGETEDIRSALGAVIRHAHEQVWNGRDWVNIARDAALPIVLAHDHALRAGMAAAKALADGYREALVAIEATDGYKLDRRRVPAGHVVVDDDPASPHVRVLGPSARLARNALAAAGAPVPVTDTDDDPDDGPGFAP